MRLSFCSVRALPPPENHAEADQLVRGTLAICGLCDLGNCDLVCEAGLQGLGEPVMEGVASRADRSQLS